MPSADLAEDGLGAVRHPAPRPERVIDNQNEDIRASCYDFDRKVSEGTTPQAISAT